MRKRYTLTGIEFHRRWREGKTICDSAEAQEHVITHHGFFSLDWKTFKFISEWNKARSNAN